MRIAVCIPTKGRPRQMYGRVNDLLLQPAPNGVELIVSLSADRTDKETIKAITGFFNFWYESEHTIALTLREPGSTAVDGWNVAYRAVVDVADWFMLGADDLIWHPGWLEEAIDIITNSYAACVGLNDGHTDLTEYAPHYMVSRDFCYRFLGDNLVPPVYKSWWFDREVCEIARQNSLYSPAWAAHVEHTHPDWQTAEMDETYTDAWHLHDIDKEIYLRRKKELLDGSKEKFHSHS